MNGKQISNILNAQNETRPRFMGVYLNNKKPPSFGMQPNVYYVFNTSDGVAEGVGHWVTFHIDSKYSLIFFDSLAEAPAVYGGEISNIYNLYPFKKALACKKPLQSEKSYSCGAYAIYYITKSAQGNSLYRIKKPFGSAKKYNDKFVENFVYRISGILKKCNRFFCPTYMFGKTCRNQCTCQRKY